MGPVERHCPGNKALRQRRRSFADLATAHADDASGNELLDLSSHARVAHVVVQSCWVALGLLQDRLHDGI
jgi:hypothetical protein